MVRLGFRPVTMSALRHYYKPSGHQPVGFGYFTTALLKDGKVLKVYEFTTRNSTKDQRMLVDSIDQRLELANRYLAPYVAVTNVKIAPHPISKKPCVVLVQDYIQGSPLKTRPYSRYLTEKQRRSFVELLERAKTLYYETGYLLDVNGHNMIAAEDKVIVVDTILMGRVDVKMRPITLRILNAELKYNNLELVRE